MDFTGVIFHPYIHFTLLITGFWAHLVSPASSMPIWGIYSLNFGAGNLPFGKKKVTSLNLSPTKKQGQNVSNSNVTTPPVLRLRLTTSPPGWVAVRNVLQLLGAVHQLQRRSFRNEKTASFAPEKIMASFGPETYNHHLQTTYC